MVTETFNGGQLEKLPPADESTQAPLLQQARPSSPGVEFLNFEGAQKSIPRNQFRQPGGPVRQYYSYSVPSPFRLFKNSSTGHSCNKPYETKLSCQLSLRKVLNKIFSFVICL